MSKYLLKVEEVYRADNEAEAAQIIEDAKKNNQFILSKYTSVKRERKQKGEIIDEWMRVTLTKTFTDEKEPDVQVDITYNVEDAFNIK